MPAAATHGPDTAGIEGLCDPTKVGNARSANSLDDGQYVGGELVGISDLNLSASGSRVAYRPTRSITFLTFETCQRPPWAVRTPRSLRARAMPTNFVATAKILDVTFDKSGIVSNVTIKTQTLNCPPIERGCLYPPGEGLRGPSGLN